MMRALGIAGFALIAVWIIAHALFLGPVEQAVDSVLAWLIGILAVAAVVASVTVLGCGLVLGRTSPAWLRFVQQARTVATVIGCALVVFGLLHYRDTQPDGEIRWLVLGVLVLVGAGVVHAWIVVTEKKHFT